MEAALTLWKRSTSLGFRYITVLADGDCKTFNYLCEKKVYGPDIVIKKEECINHVSKRLGTTLRSTVKDCRAQGISLGGKAHGSLKESTIKKLTTYYQKAILRNKGDVNAMKTAIYATLLHSISTDSKPQHSKFPAGENSWCFYQSAIANGEKPNNHKLNVGTPINEKFLPKILPIFQRLASNEFLERCIRCGTQNANESLHSEIWAKCPKEIFVNKRHVKRAVTEAVCEYNKGTVRTIVETQKAWNVATGGSTKQLATILDCRKQNLENVVKMPYPVTRIPSHTNQFAHRQHNRRWNWRNDPSQHPNTITGSRYNVYSPQLPSPLYHHPFFSLQRPTMYPRNQRLPQRPAVFDWMLQLSTPVKEPKKIIQYSNFIEHKNL
ncbi:uncharacterized protein TNCV_218771 [Trichonephila clavipes]|uniref:Mutator-like transposase domain-containing protein n=1 Tax=Trichonephila clavipes TaxID=2585209 RepID=A0A8X6VGT0_TRICX|nr:uncharacterized protein TNCV_218771 [Trichonephila clavipes]